jgi:hypothetical protein
MTSTGGIQPIYSTPEPNTPVILSKDEPVRVTANGVSEQSKANIRLEFVPRPVVVFDLSTSYALAGPAFEKGVTIVFDCHNTSVECMVLRSNISSSSDSCTMTLTPVSRPVAPPGIPQASLSTVVFHVLNLPDFYVRSPVPSGSPNRFMARHDVSLVARGWRVNISSHQATSALADSLQRSGGYGLTHVGKIEREDGSPFTREEARQVLEVLYYYLSWVRGLWVDVCLPVGFSGDGERVWVEWDLRHSSPWKTVLSWSDPGHGNLIEEVFPGFMNKWQDEFWQRPLRETIYWYLVSNVGGYCDAGLILTQAALELLAWVRCVSDQNLVSADGFNFCLVHLVSRGKSRPHCASWAN